ncbi:MAG: hypothetical protein H6640_23515 [Caldilineaceae bacterium]|nr:hypothetical protein [Caldilineaceae bacterium]
MRTSFSVSWDALAGPLQRTFALMGLFDGRSFSAEPSRRFAAMNRMLRSTSSTCL